MEAVRSLVLDDLAATCGPVLTEVIRGARHQREEKELTDQLSPLVYFPLHQEDFLEAAALGVTMRQKGYRLKTLDLLIARVSIREKIPLLHDDSDFEFIARHSSLKTLRL